MAGLHLDDLVTLFREEADDKNAPYLWSDYLAKTWANEAQIEAARRGRLLKDSTTAAIVQYALAQNAQYITLDPRVIFVRQCFLASKTLPLVRRHRKDLDRMFPAWDYGGRAGADIMHFCPDRDTGKLWFDAPSPAADTVNLSVVRIPLNDMVSQVTILTTTGSTTNTSTATASVDPEINPRYHIKLVHWMVHRAYQKQDAETNDPEKSAHALAEFEKEFGPPLSAQNEMYAEENYGYDEYDGDY